MPRISENEIKEIRENADIVEIIGSYIPLTPKGKNFFGVCPFHQDHSPSMSVSKEKQVYKCFSCGAGGNVFQFVKEYENISFFEAVSKVAEKIGMTFSAPTAYKPKIAHEQEYEIMELASIFYQNNLNTKEGMTAKDYLKDRHITSELIETFNLGLSMSSNSLLNLLEKKQFDMNKLESLGLARKNGIQYYDVFQDRIMFPIENPDGKVVGFTGRIFSKEGSPKYLNSKETILFKKGQVLYNYHRATEKTRLFKKLIMVEGNMDAMRMYEQGFPNTVALMGTSLTKDQILLIKKLRVPITLMLDNDDAGKINTYQNGMLLEQEGLTIDVVRLSGAKDPDEYLLSYGKQAMEDALNHPISFLEFKLNYFKENKNLQDSKDLVAYIQEVLKTIEKSDDLTKEITLKKLAKEYDLSYELLQRELAKTAPPKTTEQPKAIPLTLPMKKGKYELCASSILYYMMNHSKYIKMYQNKLGYFTEKKYRQIANEIVYFYEKHKTISLADFLSYAEISPIKEDILSLVQSINEEKITENNMEEYLNGMKEIMLSNELQKLKNEQHQVQDINAKLSIAIKITELCKQREELRKERSVKNDEV